ncbi:hypothetical protein ElyMa_000371400 [Elysia marginata]|uniref:Uncharacterized protein n=1 Tax=Elysia marginata TaxID=1093978 RepID=A0AAV4FGG9_9GAST|nr:hypothetical protein ElyMa_000371400 [Elysia marginata]
MRTLVGIFHHDLLGEFFSREKFFGIKSRGAYLPCAVQAEDAEWDYNTTQLAGRAYVSASKKLVINDIKSGDAGNYTCSSSLGKSIMELLVIETSKPREMNLIPVGLSMLQVTWYVPEGTSDAVTSYNILIENLNNPEQIIRKQVTEFTSSGTQSYLVKGLTSGAAYRVYVFPRYGFGLNGSDFDVAGPRSDYEIVNMPEDDTKRKPQVQPPRTASVLYAIMESPTTLTCEGIEEDKDGIWEYDAPEDPTRYRIRYRPSSKELVLVIPRPELQDVGDFTCVSSGGRSTISLVVIDRKAPQFLRASAISTTQVKLTWTVPEGPKEYITRYEIEYYKTREWNIREYAFLEELSDDGQEMFTLENLTPGETYQVKVTAKYLYGEDGKGFDINGPGSDLAEVTLPTATPQASTQASPIVEVPRTAKVYYSIKGRSAYLRCFDVSEARGTWRYNTTQIQGRFFPRYDRGVLSLTINPVTVQDSGDYACVSGAQSSAVNLVVLDPAVPQRLAARVATGNRAQVYWMPPDSGEEHISFYSLKILDHRVSRTPSEFQVKASSTSSWVSHVLNNLTPYALYDVEVRAVYPTGENGRGPLSKGPPVYTKLQVPGTTEKPTTESMPEPTTEVTSEPTTEVTSEPTTEVTSEQTTEVRPEPTTKVTSEPTAEVTTESTSEPTPEPTTESATNLTTLGTPQSSTTPRIIRAKDVKAFNVTATPIASDTIKVTWTLNMSRKPDLLIGYKVSVWTRPSKIVERVQKRLSVFSPSFVNDEDDTSAWEAEFPELRTNEKYYINVRPVLKSGFEPRVKPISLFLKETSTVLPEMDALSVRAVAITCGYVLVSYRSVTGGALTDVSYTYAEEGSSTWTQPEGRHSPAEQYIVALNLKPSTTYFFKVKAKSEKQNVEAITHVTTQPSELDVLRPTGLKAVPIDGSSANISWSFSNASMGSIFYRINVEQKQEDNTFKYRQCTEGDIAFEETSTIDGLSLDGDNQYRVSITPYDLAGAGPVSEAVLIPEESDSTTLPVEDDTKLKVVVLSVREDQATLTMNVTGQRAQRLQSYRVRVNHVTPHGPHHKEQVLAVNPDDIPFTIEDLKPHRTYEVIVHAIAKGMHRPMKSETVYIRTSDTCKSEENQTDATAAPSNVTTDMPDATAAPSNVTTGMPNATSMASTVSENPGSTMAPISTAVTSSSMSSNISSESTLMVAVPTNATDIAEIPRESLVFNSSLPDEKLVLVGDNFDLRCSVSGYPMPEIRFYKDGVLAVESEAGAGFVDFYEQNITSSFTLQCVAINDQQILMKEIKIVVLGKMPRTHCSRNY